MNGQFRAELDARLGQPSDIVDHLPELYRAVIQHPAARVLELGVRSGNSTAALLAGAEHVDGHVWSVDFNPPTVPDWWSRTGRWTLRIGDDLDPAISHRLSIDPGMFDVLFIDTSHTYEQTLTELRTYVPMVRDGGTVNLEGQRADIPAYQIFLRKS